MITAFSSIGRFPDSKVRQARLWFDAFAQIMLALAAQNGWWQTLDAQIVMAWEASICRAIP